MRNRRRTRARIGCFGRSEAAVDRVARRLLDVIENVHLPSERSFVDQRSVKPNHVSFFAQGHNWNMRKLSNRNRCEVNVVAGQNERIQLGYHPAYMNQSSRRSIRLSD